MLELFFIKLLYFVECNSSMNKASSLVYTFDITKCFLSIEALIFFSNNHPLLPNIERRGVEKRIKFSFISLF